MLERLIVAAALIGLGALFFFLFNRYQRRRAQVASRQEAMSPSDETDTSAPNGPATPGEKPRVLYFRSDHCVSCETQARLWEDLEPSVWELIEKVDVDREEERAKAYNVMTLPTTVIMDAEGDVKHINYGVVPPKKLRSQLS
jgi:thiol-disulfide isomerase/thioredoxin